MTFIMWVLLFVCIGSIIGATYHILTMD